MPWDKASTSRAAEVLQAQKLLFSVCQCYCNTIKPCREGQKFSTSEVLCPCWLSLPGFQEAWPAFGVGWPSAVTATSRWLPLISVDTASCLNTVFPCKPDLCTFHWPRHDWTLVPLSGAQPPPSKDEIILQSGRVPSARNTMRQFF